MSRYMPYGEFRWYSGNLNVALAQLEGMEETDKLGRIYEVDISYPQGLHDVHNDLPFLPFASIPHTSRVRKLMATFEDKKNYIVHYVNLKQAIANGLIVDKVCIKRNLIKLIYIYIYTSIHFIYTLTIFISYS